MRDCTSDNDAAADCKMEMIVCITFVLFWLVGCIVACSWKYVPLSKHRRDKEVMRRIELYKQQHMNVTYKDYECYYTNDKDYGYGTAEFHLAILSPLASEDGDSNNDNRKRRITGCGIREGEYTEIIEGYINYEDGSAELIEQTMREMKPNNDIKLHRGQASIKSVGRFLYEIEDEVYSVFEGDYFVKDECKCTECKMFWGMAIAEWRKIGEYLFFRPKAKRAFTCSCSSPDEGNYYNMACDAV